MNNLAITNGTTTAGYCTTYSGCYTTPRTKINISLEIDSDPNLLLLIAKLKNKLVSKGFEIKNIDINY